MLITMTSPYHLFIQERVCVLITMTSPYHLFSQERECVSIERGKGGARKSFPLQVLKKYSTANGMQVADFMWLMLLSIECMFQLRFAILEKIPPLGLPDKNPV